MFQLNNLKSMEVFSLHTLTLQNNSLVHLMPGTFNKATSLSYLDLSNNNLRTISRSSFANLRQLKLLNLAKNKITGKHEIELFNIALNTMHLTQRHCY